MSVSGPTGCPGLSRPRPAAQNRGTSQQIPPRGPHPRALPCPAAGPGNSARLSGSTGAGPATTTEKTRLSTFPTAPVLTRTETTTTPTLRTSSPRPTAGLARCTPTREWAAHESCPKRGPSLRYTFRPYPRLRGPALCLFFSVSVSNPHKLKLYSASTGRSVWFGAR